MPEGNLRQNGLVAFVVQPSMQIGPTDSAMGKPGGELDFRQVRGRVTGPSGRLVLRGQICGRLSFALHRVFRMNGIGDFFGLFLFQEEH